MAALQRALEQYDIGNHHLMSAPRAALAERLAELSPGEIKRVVFGVSGGEAIDLAIKLARAHTRRPKIISALGGYHGHTGLALAAGDEAYRKPFEPLSPGFIQVPFGDLDALEAAMDDDTAAVIFETIPATLGIAIPPEDFYAGVRRLCDRWGAVMIMDEVQTGLGRCGEVWGIDTYGVTPDIIVTGKGLSGGIYPITATLYADHLDRLPAREPLHPHFDLRRRRGGLLRGAGSAGHPGGAGVPGACARHGGRFSSRGSPSLLEKHPASWWKPASVA